MQAGAQGAGGRVGVLGQQHDVPRGDVGREASTPCLDHQPEPVLHDRGRPAPRDHPDRLRDHGRAFARVLRLLAWKCLVPLLILIPAAFLRSPKHAPAWLLPVVVGIAMIPTACLGWVKQGGEPNNAAYVTYFLLIAACRGSGGLRDTPISRGCADQAFAGRALVVLLSLNFAWQAYHNEDHIRTRTDVAMHVHDNGGGDRFSLRTRPSG